MIKIRKKITAGERAPWGYAVAYRDFASNHGIAFPIGIHLLAQIGRSIWFRIRKGIAPAWWEKKIGDAVFAARKKWLEGRNRLVRDAYTRGYQEGWQAYRQEMKTVVSEEIEKAPGGEGG